MSVTIYVFAQTRRHNEVYCIHENHFTALFLISKTKCCGFENCICAIYTQHHLHLYCLPQELPFCDNIGHYGSELS